MRAPLDTAAVSAALRPHGESVMLPAAAYTSDEVYAWELRHMFAGGWTCVGRADELTAGPVTHRALAVGDIGVLLTFSDGALWAFANVCRHRGHELLPLGGAAQRRAVACPYHGWGYRLDGTLLSSPGDNWDLDGLWVGGSMDLRDGVETMSLDGVSGGRPLPGVDPRTVRYLGLFPNLLVSAHPDYVMAHRLEPVAPERTLIECSWFLPPGVTDPSYAVDFWDLTNRQYWSACESVQRGLANPHFRPGPLAANEDAVYQWVNLVARIYHDPAGPLAMAAP